MSTPDLIFAAGVLMSLYTASEADTQGFRPPTQKEMAKGVPRDFWVKELTRPSGRIDKEFYSSMGHKYRSIVQIHK